MQQLLLAYLLGELSIGARIVDWMNDYRLVGEKSGFVIMEIINFVVIGMLVMGLVWLMPR